MHSRRQRLGAVTAAAALASALGAGTALAAPAEQGPSSSTPPYVIPIDAASGVRTTSILTAGDVVGGYKMAGTPDGLGAFDNHDGTFTLLSNHEFGPADGRVRDHGATGSFVSSYTVDKDTLKVESGKDLIKQVALWDPATSSYSAPAKGVAFNRFCSATLADRSAFGNRHGQAKGRYGFSGRLFTNGEESGTEGRAFAHALDGTSYELPAMGNMSFENVVPNAGTGKRTVAALTDDSTPGQVYVYAGDKQRSGNPVERAGLNNGHVFGIRVDGFRTETDAGLPGGRARFTGADLGDQRNRTGAQLESDSDAANVTEFLRPEDSSWEPSNPRVLFFNTTNRFDGPSRLWRLTFDDPADPATGGVIEQVLDGPEAGHRMLDNVGTNGTGRSIVQEDPGNNPYVARVHLYDPIGDELTPVAIHDPSRFTPGQPGFITQDEESSGVIDAAKILGDGWWLLSDQIHARSADPEVVEGGQLTAMYVPQSGSGRRR